jgi:hypothetical protein
VPVDVPGEPIRCESRLKVAESDESGWSIVRSRGSRKVRTPKVSPVEIRNQYGLLADHDSDCHDSHNAVDAAAAEVPVAPRPAQSVSEQVEEGCNAWLAAKLSGVCDYLGVTRDVAEELMLQALARSSEGTHPQGDLVRNPKLSPSNSNGDSNRVKAGPNRAEPGVNRIEVASNSKAGVSGCEGHGGDSNSQSSTGAGGLMSRNSKTGGLTSQNCIDGIDKCLLERQNCLDSRDRCLMSLRETLVARDSEYEVGENESSEEDDRLEGEVPGKVYAVIADTGATVRVIGKGDASRAVNVRKLSKSVEVETAQGRVLVDSVGDLPGYGGLMDKCLMMPECSQSLMPVNTVCEEHDLGYIVDRGGTGARFHRGGLTVLEMVPSGHVMLAPSDGPNKGDDDSLEGECLMALLPNDSTRSLHLRVMTLSHDSSSVIDPNSKEVSEPKWMLEHALEGHPYRTDCPWCVQSRLRARKAVRKLRESMLSPSGLSVVSDFSGPHEMGVTGSRFTQNIVDLDSGWGYVGLQKTRTDSDTLKSIQDMIVMLKS